MIHKYLKELVDNNNRIIIPDFGAFMVQDTPEGKQISFNDFLKFNDGLLVNQIIKSEKISKNEATEQIKIFVKDVESAFSKKTSYEVKEVGFLTKDDHGNIKFELKASDKEKQIQPTDAKPTIVLDEKKEPAKVEPAKTKITETKKEPKVETKAPTNTEVEKPVKKEDIKPTASETNKPISKPIGQTTTKKAPTKIPLKPANQMKQTPQKPISNSPTKATSSGGNNNTTLIIIIVAAVIILGGLGFSAFKFHWFGIGQDAPVVEVIPIEEPIVDTVPEVDSTIIEIEPKVIEETPAIDSNTKRYYIVAGSFKVASNAENYNQKLIDEGYKSELVIRSNGYHTVSYTTLYNWDDALTEWRNMRNTNSETWILIK